MLTVSARDANQQFSKMLDEAVNGEIVVITRRGKPVAKLVQIGDPKADDERRRRVDELMAHLEAGALSGGRVVDWTRDELYEREA